MNTIKNKKELIRLTLTGSSKVNESVKNIKNVHAINFYK